MEAKTITRYVALKSRFTAKRCRVRAWTVAGNGPTLYASGISIERARDRHGLCGLDYWTVAPGVVVIVLERPGRAHWRIEQRRKGA